MSRTARSAPFKLCSAVSSSSSSAFASVSHDSGISPAKSNVPNSSISRGSTAISNCATPAALPVDCENFVGQNLEHPGAETGIVMITIECAKSAEHRVLQGVFEIALFKNHPARIILEIGLNRLKQTYKSNRLFLSIPSEDVD